VLVVSPPNVVIVPDAAAVDIAAEEAAAGFVLRLGRALHMYGYTANGLEDVLEQVSTRLGLKGQFFASPTSISAAFGEIERQRSHLVRVEPGEVDLGRLAALDEICDRVLDGLVTPAEGSRAIEAIVDHPSAYHPYVRTLAYGLASAASCRVLGGGSTEMLLSSGVGLLIGVLSVLTSRSQKTGRVFEFVAAFIASLTVNALAATGVGVSSGVTILAGLIVLLPGLTLTLAMAELSSRHLVAGTARMAGALTVLLGITFGVATGARVARSIAGMPPELAVVPTPDWVLAFALLATPLAFSILLRAQPRDVGWIVAISLIGYAGAQIGAGLLGPGLGGCLGAFAVGIASNRYERLVGRPATVPMVPGVLLLVPGSIGFRSFALLLEQQVVVGVDAAFTMTMTAISLAAGLLLANVLVPPVTKKASPLILPGR
jgi:uncharacterized membrane protein YjjP (DUF1212 family)